MCTVKDIVDEIRISLNECTTDPDRELGCGCNFRYSDDDIVGAINHAIHHLVGLRPDQFTQDVDVHIDSDKCRINVCEHGCDQFVKLAYSKSDPCYYPENVCSDKASKQPHHLNSCLTFHTDVLNDATVYEYHFDPKSPCTLMVQREDMSLPTDIVLECTVYPEPYKLEDELPEKLCKKYHDFLYHMAIFHLIDRDHRPTQEYIAFSAQHRDTANLIMRDINIADREFHSRNYLGEKLDDCN